MAGEEAGERGQRAGAEGRRRDLEADGVGSVALADARRRLGDQQREDRGEQEAEGEEAREGARPASRQAHHEGGQGRAGHAEAEERRRRHVVGDRSESQASDEDAAPVGGRGEARGGGRHPARLREQAEGPLAGARLDAGVEEEDERVRAHARLAQRVAQAARDGPRARGAGPRRGQLPEAEGELEARGHPQQARGEEQVAPAPAVAGGDHRRHDQRPDHRAEPPAGVKPGDDAGREAGGGEGVDGRVDGPGAEAGDEAPGHDQGPPRRRGPGGGARRHQEAARHEQTADAEPLEDGTGAEAGGEVARGHRQEDQAQLVDRPVEAAPQRGPGDTQDAVRQAEAHEGEEGERDDKASRVARHGRLSPV